MKLFEVVNTDYYAIVLSHDRLRAPCTVGKFGPLRSQELALKRGALCADKWEFIINSYKGIEWSPQELVEWARKSDTQDDFDLDEDDDTGMQPYEYNESSALGDADVNSPDNEVQGFPSYNIGEFSQVIVAMDVAFNPNMQR